MIFNLEMVIFFFVFVFIFIFFLVFWIFCEYECGVIFMFGCFWKVKGLGLVIVIFGIQQFVKVDLCVVMMDVLVQDVIFWDNVLVKVNVIVFFWVVDLEKVIIQVENFFMVISQLVQIMLWVVLGKYEFDEMLVEWEWFNFDVQQIFDVQIDFWGIKVINVEIKYIDFNESMVCVIVCQVEVECEWCVKVIYVDGEKQVVVVLMEVVEMFFW